MSTGLVYQRIIPYANLPLAFIGRTTGDNLTCPELKKKASFYVPLGFRLKFTENFLTIPKDPSGALIMVSDRIDAGEAALIQTLKDRLVIFDEVILKRLGREIMSLGEIRFAEELPKYEISAPEVAVRYFY